MQTIYLDNNATTAVAPEVAQAMLAALTEGYGNPSSLHVQGTRAAEAIAQARTRVARLVGASPREIVFTSGGTEGDQTALFAAAHARRPRRRILTTAVEHPAVHAPLERLASEGFEVVRVGVEPSGALRIDELLARIDDDCALVSVMWANNETGVLHDVRTIGAACRKAGVLFHVDGVQAVGRMPVRLRELEIDYLTVSGHKLHGPKGVGALYVRRGAPLEALIVGGSQEAERRAGTENVPGIVGLGAAAELAERWLQAGGATQLAALRDRLEHGLCERIPRVRVSGAGLARSPGTCNLILGDVSGEALVMLLSEEGLCASSGSACSSGKQAPSHVLLAMGLSPAEASSSLRLSLSRFTTAADVERALELVPAAVAGLRSLLGSLAN